MRRCTGGVWPATAWALTLLLASPLLAQAPSYVRLGNRTLSESLKMSKMSPVCGVPTIPLPENPVDGVCRDIDIRYNVRNLELLRNCTVIEGSLHITLIEYVPQSVYDNYSFPDLREITGHLMMFKVFGLETMKNMFPNLAVIRGEELFSDRYALFIHELRDLQELGLIGLTNILNGSVRLTKNFRLCYILTIDWSKIAKVPMSEHHFIENRKEGMCPDFCHDDCRVNNSKHCWSSTPQDCQKNIGCKCGDGQTCMANGTCCHDYCLGGCSGLSARQCHVCRSYQLGQDCMPTCPPNTYIVAGRRCLTDKECLSLPPLTPHKIQNFVTNNTPKLLQWQGQKHCVFKCPLGFTVNEVAGHRTEECVQCHDSCPKVCNKTKVYSLKDSEQLLNCTKIQGDLDILLYYGGADMDTELTKNLGQIKEVTGYLKIMRSYGLVSLHFFQSLEIIGGERLVNEKYSLVIIDNPNLEKLFPAKQMEKMKIYNGSVNIIYNRMLCPKRVEHFLNTTNKSSDITPEILNQNGDMNPCVEEKIKFDMTHVTAVDAKFIVHLVTFGDTRQIRSYILWYKAVTKPLLDKKEGRDRCFMNDWQSVSSPEQSDLQDGQGTHFNVDPSSNSTGQFIAEAKNITLSIINLKPFTTYAALVSAKTLTSTGFTADSDLLYFRTSPAAPSRPRKLQVESLGPHELLVTWYPPGLPNGVIKFYRVSYTPEDPQFDSFRDYCSKPPDIKLDEKISPQSSSSGVKQKEKVTPPANNTSCCSCDVDTGYLPTSQDIEYQIENTFENKLMIQIWACTNKKTEVKSKQPQPTAEPESPPEPTTPAVRKRRSSPPGRDFYNPITALHLTQNDFAPDDDSNSTDEDFMVHGRFPQPKRNVSGQPTNSTSKVIYPHQVDVNDTKITLPNLKHHQLYKIEVEACQDSSPQHGPLCSAKETEFGQTASLSHADNLNTSEIFVGILPNKTNEVIVTWDAPENPNGRILQYNIRVTKVPGSEDQASVHCINANNSREYHIHLEPGNYSIQVRAVSQAGNGTYSEPKYIFIPFKEEKMSAGLIAGIVVGPLFVAFALTSVLCYFLYLIKKKPSVIVSENPHYMRTEEVYSPDEWEVPRSNIRLNKELGQGSFGTVYEGFLEDPETKTSTPVAIKTLGDKSNFFERLKILKEATTMKVFECHHVVKLIGVVSVGQPAFIVMELMSQGDLRNYLRKCRIDEDEYPDYHPPTAHQIRQMAGEIADGMAYLAHRKIVHRDLAARNCLVAEDGTVKIADFGMARDVYTTDYYRKDDKGFLPIRWMPPESLVDGIFTTMSDIWSYGVVLWEMVTLAEQPYQGLGNDEVLHYVKQGRVMNAPIGCPVDLYDLMLKCWAFNPKKRPTFMYLIECLAPHLNEKFQRVSFFFQEMAKEEAQAEADMAAAALSSPDETEGKQYRNDEAETYFNCDNSSLRARKLKAENSSASGSLKSSRGMRNLSSEDEDSTYMESCPARISPTPSTPSASSRRSAHQQPESGRHSQLYPRPVVTSDLSESDNDFESETFDQGAVVQRDAHYMLSPKDVQSSSERLKLLPKSSGSQKPKVGTLVLPAPLSLAGSLDKDEYTVMSPPASSSRSQFSPLYLFPTSSLQSPSWEGKPAVNADDPKYKLTSVPPKNGGIHEAIWPNTLPTLASPGQEGKMAVKLAGSPVESIKSVGTSSPTSDGSKDSNSSGGSSHRFHPANGHGPFHHQQTAFC